MIGRKDKDLIEARQRSRESSRKLDESLKRAHEVLEQVNGIKILEVGGDQGAVLTKTSLAEYKVASYADAVKCANSLEPDLVLFDRDGGTQNELMDVLGAFTGKTFKRVLLTNRDEAIGDDLKSKIDLVLFKPVDSGQIVKVAYFARGKRDGI